MERKGSVSKRPTKGHPSAGDFIALGVGKPSQSRTGPESDLRHTGTGGAQPLGRKIPSLSDRKREASGPSGLGLASKKPKLLGQTFTPLGRPADIERRGSPALPVQQFEEAAIEVDGASFLDQILEAESEGDDERVERLLCGTVKHFRTCRSKPDPAIFLSVIYVSKTKPTMFGSELVIEAFCSLLKRDMTINFKSKGNPLVSVLACNALMAGYLEEENWPEEFVKVYVEDSLGERVWVDREDCNGFVANIQTAFNTKIPPKSSQTDTGKTGEPSGATSPAVSMFEDDEKSNDGTDKPTSMLLESNENITTFPRFPYQQDGIETYILEVIREQFNRRQPMDASSRNLVRLMTVTCGYGEVRVLASQRLEMWLQNPKLAKPAQDLLMSVCLNCAQLDKSDVDVIKQLLKIRLKTKPLMNHYLLSVRELLPQHSDNLKLILTHTIYNELSSSRNPNNMSLIGSVFQHSPEQGAKVLAEIFQDLLANKDDYVRALRALLREIVRSLRHEVPFSNLCLGLMQERLEPKFIDMEPAFKERYVNSVADLITLSILLGVTPGVREAAAALLRGERRELEPMFQHHRQAAIIERDSVWWLHTVVPKIIELKPAEYMHCLRKVLFMESPEHYYNKDNWPPEGDRGVLLKLASEAPVLEDTLMRILVIGLSRELPVNASDAMDLADTLVKRAAMLYVEGHDVLHVERLAKEFIDALLNLCAYRHPENIVLPKGYQPPSLAISALYWRAWNMLLIICAFNPTTFGRLADNYPTLKCMIEMVITNNYQFPPPTSATEEKFIDEIRSRELQVEQLEKQQILEFETHLAAASKMTITEHNSLLIAQLTSMNPNGIARRPPPQVLDQLKTLNNLLKIRQMFCRSRDPDFLSDIIKRQGTSQSMPWLADLVESSEGSLDVLPVQCLCEFLLHDSPQDLIRELEGEDESKPETRLKRMKLRKQEQLLSRLQKLVHDGSADSQTTFQVLDYFLQRLASHQASARQLAIKGLSMVISLSSSPDDGEDMEVDEDSEAAQYMPQHKWLLVQLPTLPVFPAVRVQLCLALRQACQIETDPSLVSAYIVFLSQYAMNQQLHDLDDLAVDLGQLIVERCTIINHMFPMERERRFPQAEHTLRSLVHLYASYLRKAKEPDKAAYTWSDTQDQILLQWASGESATMHVLVVHAMVILLSYGPPKGESAYEELLETWFPANSHPPSAFLLDTSEEALLLPDWLKLRMIRSSVQRVVDAALQDLEPSQLLLFVQSFGIPVSSMSKLLQCLDNAATMDSLTLEQAVIDKAYMAQLIEIQQMRGASGGDNFYSLLTHGVPKAPPVVEEEKKPVAVKETLRIENDKQDEDLPRDIPGLADCLRQIFVGIGNMAESSKLQRRIIKTLTVEDTFPNLLLKAFELVLGSEDGPSFVSSLHEKPHLSCPVLRLYIAKQEANLVNNLFEKLSSMSSGQRSAVSAMINQYLTSHKRRCHRQGGRSEVKALVEKMKTDGNRLDDDKLMGAVTQLDGEKDPRLEMLLQTSISSAMEADRSEGTRLACTLILANEHGKKLPTSAANLLIDWLELLDPEVIQSAPDLQQMLLFAKQGVSGQESNGQRKNNQPYLLALLTHQSNWSTLHRCIDLLLRRDNISKYDSTCVLDFLWACYNIPKIWQGRDRKLPKNYTPEDVLGLTDDQLITLIEVIVEEGANSQLQSSAGSQDQKISHDANEVISCRAELLKCCLCGREEKIRIVIDHILAQIKEESERVGLYRHLLVELYLQFPYISSWLEDNSLLTLDSHCTQRSNSQLDMISHRLITTLGQATAGKQAENRMQDANIACRKLAAQHPMLFLRQLPMLTALLQGRTQFTFGEMRHRNYLLFFTHVLGLLELLQPHIFRKEFTSLEDLLQVFFDLIEAHGDQRPMASVIVKFVTFLHNFVSQDPQRAAKYLQQHVHLLSEVSNFYPDLSVLKSLLAGLTLPRQNASEEACLSGEVIPVASRARPSSPWTTSQLEPFHKRLNKQNMEDVLEVLRDLDESSKRKVDILQFYVDDLNRLIGQSNDRCRNTAFTLLMRHIRHSPRSSVNVLPAFLHCLDSENPDVINSALKNLPEFAVLCQDHASVLLQRAFSVGINTTVETHTYISDALQLLNMETA